MPANFPRAPAHEAWRALAQLAVQCGSMMLTVEEMGVCVGELMMAYGEFDEKAGAAYKAPNPAKLADLIYENGPVDTARRLGVIFVGALSGGYTASGEVKAAGKTTKPITLVRASLCFWQTNTTNEIRKNGSSAYSGHVLSHAAVQGRRSFATAPLIVTPGDYFDVFVTGSTGTHAGLTTTWFGLELMDPTTKYCIACKSADQALSAAVTTTIAWDGTDIADANNMHDPATNNSRVTVPSGVSLARPFLNVVASGSSSDFYAWINKNGSSSYNGFTKVSANTDNPQYLIAYGPILPVTGGTDYFEAQLFNNSACTLKGGNQQSYFGLECFTSGYSYCTAYKSVTQALTANVEATLLLESEVADTDNCHDTTANKGNFVCPSGKTKARVSFNVCGASTTSGTTFLQAIAKKNGSHVQGLPHYATANGNEENLNAIGNWIPVTSGDILRVDVMCNSGQTLPASAETWVCVEWA